LVKAQYRTTRPCAEIDQRVSAALRGRDPGGGVAALSHSNHWHAPATPRCFTEVACGPAAIHLEPVVPSEIQEPALKSMNYTQGIVSFLWHKSKLPRRRPAPDSLHRKAAKIYLLMQCVHINAGELASNRAPPRCPSPCPGIRTHATDLKLARHGDTPFLVMRGGADGRCGLNVCALAACSYSTTGGSPSNFSVG